MAYDKKKIHKQAVELVVKENLIYIEDIIMLLPIGKDSFYRFFPTDSDEYDTIKKAIDKNKINLKVKLRKQMFDADTPTDRAMLYKLIGTEEERSRLNKSELQHSGEIGGKRNDIPFNVRIVNGEDS